jgi:hypothetical protein
MSSEFFVSRPGEMSSVGAHMDALGGKDNPGFEDEIYALNGEIGGRHESSPPPEANCAGQGTHIGPDAYRRKPSYLAGLRRK